jgi:choline kinase
MNIIIPAAGLGKRFAEDGYSRPKPLVNVLGEALIARVIESLKVEKSDKIFIVYTQRLEKYHFKNVLKKRFYGLDLNFILLKYDTRGPAETILCGLNKIGSLDEMTLVVDCDTFYTDDIVRMARETSENCIFYFEDKSKEAMFSYIKIDPRNRVFEIKEKIKVSHHACTGAYAFRNGKLLKEYCEQILNAEDKSNGEYYVSNVYARMIVNHEVVLAFPIKNFVCLGTPEQLKTYCSNNNTNKKRFCFDLDGTLVSFPDEKNNYKSVAPIMKNIKLARYLHDQGHIIIIQTARRMLSSGLNAGLATRNAYEDVFGTLKKYDIPFNEIYFGKPFAHFYIDDLSVSAFDVEKETGFYNARIEARHFNNITYDGDCVIKTTDNPGEIYWYRHIPQAIKEHFAQVIFIEGKTIKMEKINGIVFSYLLVNNSLTKENLRNLLDTVTKIHTLEKLVDSIDYNANYNDKIRQRYAGFDYQAVSNEAECYFKEITEKLCRHIPIEGIIHGDLVFSNVFLCNNQLIRFIDMRGKVGEVETIYGDIFYDFAKIYQSLWGYDFILNDCEINETYLKDLREYFENWFTGNFSQERLEFLKTITASLLFSLIPLHTELEKQKKYFELVKEIIQ